MRFAPIQSLRAFKITSDDAETFLQGQVTSDINKLNEGWQISGYCSPKGRLLGLFYFARIENEIIGLLESSLADSVIKRLRMYVLRSKVIITELEQARITGLLTPGGELGTVSEHAGTPCLDFGFGKLLLDFAGTAGEQKEDENGESLSEAQWWSAMVQAGIPTITEVTQELFVPQMVNLDLLGGISFKKGCYTGQEIVARMHYLGKLKQRLFVCQSDANAEDLLAGQKVVGQKIVGHDGSNAGTLITPFLDGHGLAVLRLDKLSGGLQLECGLGMTIKDPQPYSFDI